MNIETAARKTKSKNIVKELNSDWNRHGDWFCMLDIDELFDLLNKKTSINNKQRILKDQLNEFHCQDYDDMDRETLSILGESIVEYFGSEFISYDSKRNKFIFVDQQHPVLPSQEQEDNGIPDNWFIRILNKIFRNIN